MISFFIFQIIIFCQCHHKCFILSVSVENGSKSGVDLFQKAKTLFKQMLEEKKSWEEVNENSVWESIRERVQATQVSLKERSRTSALWLQYMEMIDILRSFIKAERTGN